MKLVMKLIATLIVLLAMTSCTGELEDVDAQETREIVVFAAASLTEVCDTLKSNYEIDHPNVSIVYNFAGSQVLASQIEEGAKPHMFFSANEKYVDQLIEEGINPFELAAYRPQKSVFATNKLVLIYSDAYDFDTFADSIDGLKEDVYQPIILAFEEVPVGKYTRSMMDNYLEVTGDQAGYDCFYDQVVSYESDVKAVLAKVRIHECDMGIVYRTDANSLDLQAYDLKYLEIEDSINMTATYGAIAFSDNEEAQDFYDYVVNGHGQKLLADKGF